MRRQQRSICLIRLLRLDEAGKKFNMKNCRKHGEPPFRAVLLHGGPGAAGEMAPVAQELSSICGILEPFQTKHSIDGQVEELHGVIKQNADVPVILVGYSWGAFLSFIFAARHPSLVSKLILVSSGPFEDKYAPQIMQTRLSRLNTNDRSELEALMKELNSSSAVNDKTLMPRIAQLITIADSYDPITDDHKIIDCRSDIYKAVWPEADKLRKSGELLEYSTKIQCPVVAIHGDYDPDPPDGVNLPLSQKLRDFRFVLIPKCGHKPWIERYARVAFFKVLIKEF